MEKIVGHPLFFSVVVAALVSAVVSFLLNIFLERFKFKYQYRQSYSQLRLKSLEELHGSMSKILTSYLALVASVHKKTKYEDLDTAQKDSVIANLEELYRQLEIAKRQRTFASTNLKEDLENHFQTMQPMVASLENLSKGNLEAQQKLAKETKRICEKIIEEMKKNPYEK